MAVEYDNEAELLQSTTAFAALSLFAILTSTGADSVTRLMLFDTDKYCPTNVSAERYSVVSKALLATLKYWPTKLSAGSVSNVSAEHKLTLNDPPTKARVGT